MRFFFVVEVVPLTIDLILNIALMGAGFGLWLGPAEQALIGQAEEFIWLVYPLLQAYGMLRLKDSRDPISGISDLDYIMMVSRNQVLLDSYEGTMVQRASYKKLTEEAQAQMLEKLEESRTDSVPSTLMTQHSINSVSPRYRNASVRFGSVEEEGAAILETDNIQDLLPED